VPGLSDPANSRAIDWRVQVVAGLQAATLLGRGEGRGIGLVLLSAQGAARSFWAAAICLLPFLAIRLLGTDALAGAGLTVELIGYVLGWVVFPLATLPLVEASGRGPLWPSFVAAWNWANVAQYTVLLAATLVEEILPGPVANALNLMAFGYALWLEWFVARTALRISGFRAGLFVVLDVMIGLTIALTVGRFAR
jgi:hypothetical protein